MPPRRSLPANPRQVQQEIPEARQILHRRFVELSDVRGGSSARPTVVDRHGHLDIRDRLTIDCGLPLSEADLPMAAQPVNELTAQARQMDEEGRGVRQSAPAPARCRSDGSGTLARDSRGILTFPAESACVGETMRSHKDQRAMDRPRITAVTQRKKSAMLRRAEEREEAKRRAEEEKRREAWEATDHGRAQLAHDAGERFFQMQRVVSTTRGQTPWMMGASSVSAEADQSANVRTGTSLASMVSEQQARSTDDLPVTQTLAVVEQIGWSLAHVGYTYRETYSKSRDRFLASGQQTAKSGEIVAVYLFRRKEASGSE